MKRSEAVLKEAIKDLRERNKSLAKALDKNVFSAAKADLLARKIRDRYIKRLEGAFIADLREEAEGLRKPKKSAEIKQPETKGSPRESRKKVMSKSTGNS